MSQIWKCGYCNETQVSLKKMKKHESKCPSNPGSRLCFSCNNYIPGSKICHEKIITFNVYTSGVPCDRWLKKHADPERKFLNQNH